MTVERARELLGFEDMTDDEIKNYIMQSKQLCKGLLQMIIKEQNIKVIDNIG